MAKRNAYGKFIIAAGEVGAFTVCPEAWRLRVVEKAKTIRFDSASEGVKLHAQWAQECTKAVSLKNVALWVICLIATATIFFALWK